ncbi:RtcB family protein [Patescibacteria group bacterium]
MYILKQSEKNKYIIKKHSQMNADVVIYISEKIKNEIQKDRSIDQLIDAASLPKVINPVVGMPDIHEGYGLPIGGIMAMPENGLVSAGAVGMDINCGARLIRSEIKSKDLDRTTLRNLMLGIESKVPLGTGGKNRLGEIIPLEEIAKKGAGACVAHGFGVKEDLEHTEENGLLAPAILDTCSKRAVERGRVQLGTLGAGNHFIDLQNIVEIYDEDIADVFGLEKGNLSVMIHCGSRGLGHQVCTDYTDIFWDKAQKTGIEIPIKGLAAAPIESKEGQDYLEAMTVSVNFAFANRQMIMHDVRTVFENVLEQGWNKLGLDLVYDVAHNIAKWEEHKGKKVLIHRKGATRALPKNHKLNPKTYFETGHPALIPGSMGTASYVVVGTDKCEESYYSVNHGAGRKLARGEAKRSVSLKEFEKWMDQKGILINERNLENVKDESPFAYKNIEEVISVLEERGMIKKIAKLEPIGVIVGVDRRRR